MSTGSGSPGDIFEYEYGISHADFERIFPRVVPPEQTQWSADGVRVSYPDGRALVITLSAEQTRKLGSFGFPYTFVRFEFQGWGEHQRREFMEKFNLSFHKGGG